MRVVANGKRLDLPEGATITDLLDHLGLAGRLIVAERNGEAIPRRELPVTVLREGDTVELVRAVAGG